MCALQTPARGRAGGFTDWVGPAAACRRRVADAFLDTFSAWGYEYLATPLVEPLETVAAGVGGGRQADLFRFMDADGRLLALVGERTVSVARVVATQLRTRSFPLRLCYSGPVLFNRPPLGGRRRETMQAGCELVGHGGLEADAECLAVAAAALEAAGITGVQIDVGHADFVPSLLAAAHLDADSRSRVARALRHRDLVAVETALEGTEAGAAERALLLAFPTLRGGRELLDSAGARLSEGCRRSLDELARLWDLLDTHGITDRVHLDLGAVRDWDYYTGPTFELFSAELGFPLGSGGRYDRLLASFGLDAPATGFVLHVDRCCDALQRSSGPVAPAPVLRILYARGRAAEAMAVAVELRRRGLRVALDLTPAEESAFEPGVRAAWVDAAGVLSWHWPGHSGSGLDGLVAAIPLLRGGQP
ncbi:MAG TPA: ATP phosphoribosyltransferase regulatory subunit [Candidatus Binatia bacterium]|nr:ATP phosphoribosyltransferase regulatory subunit [Candidatus Binatia bacterium]